MGELERLIEQKKEIEKRIKEIKTQEVRQGRVKYHIVSHKNYLGDEYLVSVKLDRWNRALSSFSRDSLLEEIPKLIDDLQKLYEKLQ